MNGVMRWLASPETSTCPSKVTVPVAVASRCLRVLVPIRKPCDGLTVVVTVTGHGLKDTATALESAGDVVDAVIDPDLEQAASAAGLR